MSRNLRIVSESKTRGSWNGILPGWVGHDPVAIRNLSALSSVRVPSAAVTATVLASVNDPALLGVHIMVFDIGGDARLLAMDDLLLAIEEVAGGDPVLHFQVDAEEAALLEAGEIERRFPERLGGQGAGIGGGAAEARFLLDDGDFLAQEGGLRPAFLTRRS